jgi:hypothetical protein
LLKQLLLLENVLDRLGGRPQAFAIGLFAEMVEIARSLVENEPTLLIDLNILGKRRERKAGSVGLSADIPKRSNP